VDGNFVVAAAVYVTTLCGCFVGWVSELQPGQNLSGRCYCTCIVSIKKNSRKFQFGGEICSFLEVPYHKAHQNKGEWHNAQGICSSHCTSSTCNSPVICMSTVLMLYLRVLSLCLFYPFCTQSSILLMVLRSQFHSLLVGYSLQHQLSATQRNKQIV
jgi:hypothetical protein